MKPKKEYVVVYIAFGLVLALALFLNKSGEAKTSPEVWSKKYDVSMSLNSIPAEYLEDNEYFKQTENIKRIAANIKKSSTSEKDAIRKTLNYVKQYIKYESADDTCYADTVDGILDRGTGDCVSMTRIVMALLRAQGFAVRDVGGCLAEKAQCIDTYSMVKMPIPEKPKMMPGDFRKRGSLHEWAEVWTSDGKWLILETTAGQIIDPNCSDYLLFDRVAGTKEELCYIYDEEFWAQCYVY